MANKKIHRARVTRRKESPIERFLRLGIALSNRHQVLYSEDNSLWFAIYTWDKYICSDFYEYMNECIEYDKLHKNHKRIKEWEKLLGEGLTVEQMKQWADEERKKEWSQLMTDIEHEIANKF